MICKKIKTINSKKIISQISRIQTISNIKNNILNYVSNKIGIEIDELKFLHFYNFYLDSFSLNYKDNEIECLNGFLIDPIVLKTDKNKKEIYWGYLSISLKKNGFGINLTSEGHLYIGNFKNDKFKGKGIYLFNSQGRDTFSLNVRNNADFLRINNEIFNDLIFTMYDNENIYELNNKDIIVYKGYFNNDIPEASGKLIIRDETTMENSSVRLLFNINKNKFSRRISFSKGKVIENISFNNQN